MPSATFDNQQQQREERKDDQKPKQKRREEKRREDDFIHRFGCRTREHKEQEQVKERS